MAGSVSAPQQGAVHRREREGLHSAVRPRKTLHINILMYNTVNNAGWPKKKRGARHANVIQCKVLIIKRLIPHTSHRTGEESRAAI